MSCILFLISFKSSSNLSIISTNSCAKTGKVHLSVCQQAWYCEDHVSDSKTCKDQLVCLFKIVLCCCWEMLPIFLILQLHRGPEVPFDCSWTFFLFFAISLLLTWKKSKLIITRGPYWASEFCRNISLGALGRQQTFLWVRSGWSIRPFICQKGDTYRNHPSFLKEMAVTLGTAD